MKRFKSILVGVDVADSEHLVAENFTPSTSCAIDTGIWLAKKNNAQLHFLNVLESSDYARLIVEEHSGVESELTADTKSRLDALVQKACNQGIDASSSIAFGKCWFKLIQDVLKHQHDILIVGTRERGVVSRTLFGSTGLKLIRKCPCPVWITKPQQDLKLKSILIADDLTSVGDLAVELGLSLADLHDAESHILHVLELGLGRPEWDSINIRTRLRARAGKQLSDQIARCEVMHLKNPPRIEVEVDDADAAILKGIERDKADLLVMGTLARGGIAGALIGNTAERLLSTIPCSVLAIKPEDYVCPIIAE